MPRTVPPHQGIGPVDPAPSTPRALKPVFQASGVCRSDVLTAHVANATNTRHRSFWLTVKEGREPWSSPGERSNFASQLPQQTHVPLNMSAPMVMCSPKHICPNMYSPEHICPESHVLAGSLRH